MMPVGNRSFRLIHSLLKTVLFLCAAAAVPGCAATPIRERIPVSESATLTITVTDSTTRQALQSVLVSLRRERQPTIDYGGTHYTDSLGKLTLVGLDTGRYLFRARRIGYEQRTTTIRLARGVNRLDVRTRPAGNGNNRVTFDWDDSIPTSRAQSINVDSLHDANDRRWFSVVVIEFDHMDIVPYPVMFRNPIGSPWGPVYPGKEGYLIVEQPPLGPTLVEAICPGLRTVRLIAGSTMVRVTPRMQGNVQVWVDPKICKRRMR